MLVMKACKAFWHQRTKQWCIFGGRVTATEGSQVVYQAGEGLGVPLDWVRREHVMILLRSNQDELAEELMGQVSGTQREGS